MKWEAKIGSASGFADLESSVGKAGTNDSVAIVSAIIFIARLLRAV